MADDIPPEILTEIKRVAREEWPKLRRAMMAKLRAAGVERAKKSGSRAAGSDV